MPLLARFAIAAVIALVHFYVSFMLLNYAYALGDASRPVPLSLKIALLIAGAPLAWLAYFVRFFIGRWDELAFYLLMGLTPINSVFCGWLLMRLFTWRSRQSPRPV